VRSIHAGAFHTCAVLNSNQLNCWGNNASGQLGIGSQVSRSAPGTGPINAGIEP